ncbi:hypothetical protein FHW36_101421 [Chitinophaga polysaccharea]|uniref:Uncharacterized protein n=1 Tax=Chitinophaga polysaccharea TaxID=1293035 RepID=A0A561Q2A9_9BACT|nr:hypothetical protein [Chitinophaga polysaccharea]TWF44501.1 hypothetical protein FHW36_101421 [Chitinophaga polysaccharea]
MRSFVALMTCIACIAWIHSCEKRLLGVRLEKNNENKVVPSPEIYVKMESPARPASYIAHTASLVTLPTNPPRIRSHAKKPDHAPRAYDSLLFRQALAKGKYFQYNNNIP